MTFKNIGAVIDTQISSAKCSNALQLSFGFSPHFFLILTHWKENLTASKRQGRRNRRGQILADELTYSNQGSADYISQIIILSPRIFSPS